MIFSLRSFDIISSALAVKSHPLLLFLELATSTPINARMLGNQNMLYIRWEANASNLSQESALQTSKCEEFRSTISYGKRKQCLRMSIAWITALCLCYSLRSFRLLLDMGSTIILLIFFKFSPSEPAFLLSASSQLKTLPIQLKLRTYMIAIAV